MSACQAAVIKDMYIKVERGEEKHETGQNVHECSITTQTSKMILGIEIVITP